MTPFTIQFKRMPSLHNVLCGYTCPMRQSRISTCNDVLHLIFVIRVGFILKLSFTFIFNHDGLMPSFKMKKTTWTKTQTFYMILCKNALVYFIIPKCILPFASWCFEDKGMREEHEESENGN